MYKRQAVAVVYAFIVTFFVYREIPLRQFGDILRKSLRTIAMVMALISTASMFGWLLAYLKVPTMVTNLLLGVSDNKVVILLLINVMCLILGCIMDMGPLILILTPILLPVDVYKRQPRRGRADLYSGYLRGPHGGRHHFPCLLHLRCCAR